MPHWNPGNITHSRDSQLARAAWLFLGLAALLCGLWLWCCWCSFPAIPWNDIRVAPAVALHHGISAYSTATSGPITTWTYGPMPLLVLWPAGLAGDAIGAMEIAGAIHIGLTVFALTLTCLYWPASPANGTPSRNWLNRLAATLLCVLLVRNETSGYIVYSADAPGIVFGLLSLLALSHRRFWTAATCAAAAAACKQTMLGIGLAQCVWLGAVVSPRAAWQQVGRCTAAGTVIALAAISYFGVPGLWHIMVELPGSFAWAPPFARLQQHSAYLLIHIGLPLAIMAIWPRVFFNRNSPLLLPTVAFFCTLPFSLAGFFKAGGNVNSLHSFWLWFPPVLAGLTTGKTVTGLRHAASLVLALGAAMLASLWLQLSHLPVVPNVQAYREASYLAKRLPQGIWFPTHPLVTLYSDGQLYHDLDGLVVRTTMGRRLSDERFFANMPRNRQATAMLLPVGWQWVDIAEARLPKDTPTTTFGLWRIDGRLNENLQPTDDKPGPGESH